MVSSEMDRRGNVANIPTNGTDFSFFPRKPSFQATLTRIFNTGPHTRKVNFTSQKTCALCGKVIRVMNANSACQLTIA